MALIVLDASVLIAHFDGRDSLHATAEAALRSHAADDLVLPASAYAEALVVPTRHGRLAAMRSHIQALSISIEPLGTQIAERAAEIRAQHRSLRLPDALVIATGDELGADVVLTGDRRWQRVARRIRVLN
jgi:predicted nucleic acid-binding protein